MQLKLNFVPNSPDSTAPANRQPRIARMQGSKTQAVNICITDQKYRLLSYLFPCPSSFLQLFLVRRSVPFSGFISFLRETSVI